LEQLLLVLGFIGIVASTIGSLILFFQVKNKQNSPSVGVSLIIAAKNEGHIIERLLKQLQQQQYPEFEIILVADQCDDDTIEKAKNLNISNLNIFQTTPPVVGKKHALALGIEKAQFNTLLFTDADCQIVHPHWIQEMACNTSSTICIGVSLLKGQTHSFILNRLIEFESIRTAHMYVTAALIGRAYMGVGRNMSYTKEVFYQIKGFGGHIDTIGGDDDLTIQKAQQQNLSIQVHTHRESQTQSIFKGTVRQWWKQKHRHNGAASKYTKQGLIISSLLYLPDAFFYIALVLLLSRGEIYSASIIFFWRTIIFILTFVLIGQKWKYTFHYWTLPFIDLLYQGYLLSSRLYAWIIPVKQWN
jgi:glycosyltransferase involved in cell wall biosynthesis